MANYFVSLNSSGILSINDNIEIPGGNITSDHGTINFNDEHLTTTGNITTTANITGNSLQIADITSSSNNIDFNNKNLNNLGLINSDGLYTYNTAGSNNPRLAIRNKDNTGWLYIYPPDNNLSNLEYTYPVESGTLLSYDTNGKLSISGNVGIGTNIPTQKLDVTGTTKTTVLDVDSKLKIDYSNNRVNFKLGTYTTPFFAVENNGTTMQFKLNDPGTASGYYTSFHVSSSGDPDFKIAGDKISMNNNLDVDGNIEVDGNINFTGNITKQGNALVSSVWTEGNNNHIYYDNGNVGIGTGDSPTEKLEVNGTTKTTVLDVDSKLKN